MPLFRYRGPRLGKWSTPGTPRRTRSRGRYVRPETIIEYLGADPRWRGIAEDLLRLLPSPGHYTGIVAREEYASISEMLADAVLEFGVSFEQALNEAGFSLVDLVAESELTSDMLNIVRAARQGTSSLGQIWRRRRGEPMRSTMIRARTVDKPFVSIVSKDSGWDWHGLLWSMNNAIVALTTKPEAALKQVRGQIPRKVRQYIRSIHPEVTVDLRGLRIRTQVYQDPRPAPMHEYNTDSGRFSWQAIRPWRSPVDEGRYRIHTRTASWTRYGSGKINIPTRSHLIKVKIQAPVIETSSGAHIQALLPNTLGGESLFNVIADDIVFPVFDDIVTHARY